MTVKDFIEMDNRSFDKYEITISDKRPVTHTFYDYERQDAIEKCGSCILDDFGVHIAGFDDMIVVEIFAHKPHNKRRK